MGAESTVCCRRARLVSAVTVDGVLNVEVSPPQQGTINGTGLTADEAAIARSESRPGGFCAVARGEDKCKR